MTTSRSPGRAPARPGTRSERPSAVTLTTTWLARVVSPPANRHARLRQALVELDDLPHLDLPRQRERHEQRLRPGGRRGEVADVDRGGAEPELAPAEPVEPEVDALDERVLGDDEPTGQLGGVVLGPLDQAARLELAQQPELARLRELHRRPRAEPRSRRRRGSPPPRRRRRGCTRPRWTRRPRRSRRRGSRPRGRRHGARRSRSAAPRPASTAFARPGPAPR